VDATDSTLEQSLEAEDWPWVKTFDALFGGIRRGDRGQDNGEKEMAFGELGKLR
jgi:hypothetical protein